MILFDYSPSPNTTLCIPVGAHSHTGFYMNTCKNYSQMHCCILQNHQSLSYFVRWLHRGWEDETNLCLAKASVVHRGKWAITHTVEYTTHNTNTHSGFSPFAAPGYDLGWVMCSGVSQLCVYESEATAVLGFATCSLDILTQNSPLKGNKTTKWMYNSRNCDFK